MDKEILDSLFDTIDTITSRVNKLDNTSKEYSSKLTLLKTELLREIDNVVSKEIAKLPKPTESKENDYTIYQYLLSKDLNKFNKEIKAEVNQIGSRLSNEVKDSLESTVKAYISSVKDTLKGDKGKDGKDGQRGLQGLTGASGKDGRDGKDGKPGKDGKSISTTEIKKLIKEEVDKLPKPNKSEGIPIAPVPQSGLSMVAVKREIDAAIASIGIPLTEDGSNTLTNKVISDYTNIVHADASHRRVKNVSGVVINAGQPVAFSGYNSGEDAIEVTLAINTDASLVAIGIAEETLNNNSFGMIITSGILEGVDTSTYAEGSILYTDGLGDLTDIYPVNGYVQPLAFVLSSKNNGALQILAAHPIFVTGWKDLIATVAASAPSPSNAPTLSNFGSVGTLQRMEYAFGDGDYVFMSPFHVNHDISTGAKAFIHIHWTTNGTQVGTVTWRCHIQRAKGHNQETFGTPYYIELTQSTSGIAYQHMVTEVNGTGVTTTTSDASDPVLILTEPDELIMVTLEKVTDTVTDIVFGLQVDLHYESNRDTTPNRIPNFYA